ncbi:MAG: DUF1566 domain-containing protein [Thiomargarita sp.]|nr:DUF1566 domain-containing protein [Thiomargarita sp.]
MTQIILLTCIIFMLLIAFIDVRSFHRKQHINCKSIIINIGVLGTFVGIVLGLLDFDTQNIYQSVPQLLEGLKLAFLTSICGLFLSIFLSTIQAFLLLIRRDQPIDKKESENKILTEINQLLKEIVNELKQIPHTERFIKLDHEGKILPKGALQWAAVQDNNTAYIWENATTACYNDKKSQTYLNKINQKKLAGYSDWILPTLEILQCFEFDKHYFPHLQLSWYLSATPKNDQYWSINFDTGHQGTAEYAHVLLVRTGLKSG